MINLLGTRVVLSILIAMVVLGAAGSSLYYYLIPTQAQVQQDQRSIDLKIRGKRAEIAQLKIEYDLLKDQIVKFNILKKKGFFNAQDRVTARETIAQLTEKSELLKAELNLAAATVVQDQNAESAKHVLISGPMSIKISSILDQNVFKYMVALQNVFPGYLEFKDFNFTRKYEPADITVQSILKGKPQGLIEGELQFNWWSMASPAQMEANPYFNPTAVTPVPTGTTDPTNPGNTIGGGTP